MNDAASVAEAIERELAAIGTPERAEGEKRYLKSELDFLGATVWEIRRVVKSYSSRHPELTHAELVALVEALWSKPVHERRMAATFMLELHPDQTRQGVPLARPPNRPGVGRDDPRSGQVPGREKARRTDDGLSGEAPRHLRTAT